MPFTVAEMPALHADVLDVNVSTGIHVVEQVPARMIGVLVNHEFIAAGGPAPVGRQGPIPLGYLKPEAAGEPEFAMTGVKASHAELVSRTDIREVPVLVRMIEMEPRIIAGRMTIPVVIVHVLGGVHVTVGGVFAFGRDRGFATVWRRRRMAAIGGVLALGECRHRGKK